MDAKMFWYIIMPSILLGLTWFIVCIELNTSAALGLGGCAIIPFIIGSIMMKYVTRDSNECHHRQ